MSETEYIKLKDAHKEEDRLEVIIGELLETIRNALTTLAIINMPIQEGSLDVATNSDLMKIMADSFKVALAKNLIPGKDKP